jgi:hypothetical protein
MEELFLHFYKEKDYECEVVVRDEAVKELRLKMDEAVVPILTFSVEGEPCLVRRAQNAEADYAKFLPLFAEVKATFLHRDWMSHYSPGLQRAFNQLPRGQLVRNFVDGKHEGVGVDVRSFYPSLLSSVELLPVFSSMSDFQPFVRGTEVDEHCFYIVECCSDEVEGYINRKLNLVSGWSLLNCELPSWSYKVRAFICPVSLEENTFPLVVKRVGEVLGDPLSNTGKFVLNSLIGLTGKRKAQNTAGKWTTDYEEARARTADPRNVYAYAEGYLAISRARRRCCWRTASSRRSSSSTTELASPCCACIGSSSRRGASSTASRRTASSSTSCRQTSRSRRTGGCSPTWASFTASPSPSWRTTTSSTAHRTMIMRPCM